MKFRRLTSEELNELEKEFVQFLVSNGITADDWVALKASDIDKANKLIDTFSDIVLEKVLGKIEYLEKREKTNVLFFKASAKEFVIIGLSSTDTSIDLTQSASIEKLSQGATNVQIFKTSQKYTKSREEEVFALTRGGALVTDDRIFNLLKEL